MNESNDDQVMKPRWYECLPDLSFLLVIIVFWALIVLICLLPCPRRCCECCRAKSTMPAAVQTSTTVPLVVPDDIYKGYAMVFGVEVPAIARDMGLTPSP